MFTALRTLLNKWFQSPPKAIEINAPAKRPSIPGFLRADQAGDARPGEGERRAVTAHPIPYDENLLERARTQWQVSDWGCHIKRFEHTGATSC